MCLGNGTKLVDMITDRSKVYEARVLLGVTTDTEDTTGTETGKRELAGEFFAGDSEGVADNIKRVLEGFTGGYDQIPPMYSAIKRTESVSMSLRVRARRLTGWQDMWRFIL